MTWLTLALLGTLFISITTIIQRVILKEEQSDPIAFAIVFQFIVALLVFLFAIRSGFAMPPLRPLALNLGLMTVLYALFNLSLFSALKETEASEVSVLVASRFIWTFATAALFLGEPINPTRILGTLMVIGGAVVVSFKRTGWKLGRGHLLSLLAAAFFGIAFTNDAIILKTFDVLPYTVIAFALPSLFIFAARPNSLPGIKKLFERTRFLKLTLAAVLYALAAICTYSAFKAGGDATQVGPVGQLSIIVTILFGYLFLKERDNLPNKIIGALLVFAGVFFLR